MLRNSVLLCQHVGYPCKQKNNLNATFAEYFSRVRHVSTTRPQVNRRPSHQHHFLPYEGLSARILVLIIFLKCSHIFGANFGSGDVSLCRSQNIVQAFLLFLQYCHFHRAARNADISRVSVQNITKNFIQCPHCLNVCCKECRHIRFVAFIILDG